MMVTKVITLKKRGGGTRRQAVEVLKSGKFKFIKNTASNLKRKAKSAGSKIKTKAKTKGKSNKQPSRSTRSMTKGGLRLYPRTPANKILIKAGIGTLLGTIIRLATMFNRDQRVRELGFRGANIASSYGGGGSGNLGFQAVDFALSHVIAGRLNGNANGQQLTGSQLVIGGA